MLSNIELVKEVLGLQNLVLYLQAQLQEARKMNAQNLIHRMCASPLVIQYEEDDPIIHTDALPYCWDMTCPCHGCTTWAQVEDMIDYLGKPFDAGLLTSAEQDRLWQGKQV